MMYILNIYSFKLKINTILFYPINRFQLNKENFNFCFKESDKICLENPNKEIQEKDVCSSTKSNYSDAENFEKRFFEKDFFEMREQIEKAQKIVSGLERV